MLVRGVIRKFFGYFRCFGVWSWNSFWIVDFWGLGLNEGKGIFIEFFGILGVYD